MGNFGFPEMAVVAVLALLVFGPERLPELARTAAKLMAKFRSEAGRSIAELKQAADIEDLEGELRSIRRELRGVRDEVTNAVKEPTAAIRDAAKGVSAGGPTPVDGTAAAATVPPPMDPEAT